MSNWRLLYQWKNGLMLSEQVRTFINSLIDKGMHPKWNPFSLISSSTYNLFSGIVSSIFSMLIPSWICNKSLDQIEVWMINKRMIWIHNLYYLYSLFPWIIDSLILKNYLYNMFLKEWMNYLKITHKQRLKYYKLLKCYKLKDILQDNLLLIMLE